MIEIRGARVIDPAQLIDKQASIYLEEGHIRHIGEAGQSDDTEVIDASGKIVIPGVVDFCARTREPGAEHIANIASESRAAVAAGVTTMVCPPDTDPVTDNASTVERILRRAATTGVNHVVPLGAVSRKLEHKYLAEMAALKEAGCPALSDGGKPFTDMRILRRTLEYASTYDIAVILTPVDPDLAAGGFAHEGQVATRLGIPGIPESAETSALARMLPVIEEAGARVHFNHISSAKGVELLADAQSKGANITADVCAHQLFLTEHDVVSFNGNYHLDPPLRTTRDREVLRDAIKNGVISVICSDHQPLDADAKQAPFVGTQTGITGIETLLPLTLRLVEEGALDWSTAISAITCNPAQILGISAGSLSTGEPANLCMIDPKTSWRVQADQLLSAGKNTPFDGWDFQAVATATWSKGEQVFQR